MLKDRNRHGIIFLIFLIFSDCFSSGKPRLKRRGTYTICKNPSEIDEEIGAKSDDQDDGEGSCINDV